MSRVLFICKQRPANYGASYGLLNSCRFICNALHDMGIDAKLVEVIDNNAIDREVHKHKPTHVFIEALWVVPEKFDVLIPLHPKVQWHVRLHSNTPFLANEGVALEWIVKYAALQKKYSQFHIAVNSIKMVTDLYKSLKIKVVYSPNIYCPHSHKIEIIPTKQQGIISIGCFGAIRPMKNQLLQAMGAMCFADEINKTLHFNINHTRVETHGENVYKNLKALFAGSKHKLIEHEWVLHEDFMKLIRHMDMGLQVSFSETFNIVCADFVSANVPVIGSKEIEWINGIYQAEPTDIDNIVSHMWIAWLGKKINLHVVNNWGLEDYNYKSRVAWTELLKL